VPGLNTEETRLIDVLDNLLSRIKSNRNRLLVAALVLAALVLALGVTPLAYADEDTTETTTATETKADDKAAEDKSKDEKADDKTTVAAAEEAVAAATEDELLPAAVEVILETGQASVSMLQRRLKLGYARAARIVDEMEERGIVGPFEGSKPRQLLITKEQWDAMQNQAGAPAAYPADNEPVEDLID
jgi:ribosomal protein S25